MEVKSDHRSKFSDFFQASSFQMLKLKIYCDDHSSLSSTTMKMVVDETIFFYLKN